MSQTETKSGQESSGEMRNYGGNLGLGNLGSLRSLISTLGLLIISNSKVMLHTLEFRKAGTYGLYK